MSSAIETRGTSSSSRSTRTRWTRRRTSLSSFSSSDSSVSSSDLTPSQPTLSASSSRVSAASTTLAGSTMGLSTNVSVGATAPTMTETVVTPLFVTPLTTGEVDNVIGTITDDTHRNTLSNARSNCGPSSMKRNRSRTSLHSSGNMRKMLRVSSSSSLSASMSASANAPFITTRSVRWLGGIMLATSITVLSSTPSLFLANAAKSTDVFNMPYPKTNSIVGGSMPSCALEQEGQEQILCDAPTANDPAFIAAATNQPRAIPVFADEEEAGPLATLAFLQGSIQQALLGPLHFIDNEQEAYPNSSSAVDNELANILCHLQNVWSHIVDDDESDIDHCEMTEQKQQLHLQQEDSSSHQEALLVRGGGNMPSTLKRATRSKPQEATATAEAPSSATSSSTKSKDKTKSKNKTKAKSKSNFTFPLFQQGDGSEEDPDGIPTRYLQMHKEGRRDLAKQSLKDTLQWRKQENIDGILSEAQTKFDVCKEVFPHFFVGRTFRRRGSDGGTKYPHVIFVQRPALIQLDLAKRNNLTKEDLLRHYIYVNEYLWQVLEAEQPLGMMVSILDLTGLRLDMIRQRDIVQFLQTFVTVMDNHYPQRAQKTLLINAPRWFSMLYKLVSPFLREATKAKIVISSNGKHQDALLKENLFGDHNANVDDPSYGISLPDEFWSKARSKPSDGKNLTANQRMAQSEMERELKSFAMARLQEAGREMQLVA